MMYKQKEIEQWAEKKGIYIVPNFIAQMKGIAEETVEATEAYTAKVCQHLNDNSVAHLDLVRELGDIYVWWINACKIAGVDPQEAVDAAHFKINKRKGKTINGRFVKNA